MSMLCFDPVGGAAGDMILASLFDLGAPVKAVDAAIRSMGLEAFTIDFQRRQDANHIVCGFCEVSELHHHHHAHDDDHARDHHHGRHLAEILAMIAKGDFSQRAKDRAARVFRRLADAEGAVHGMPPEKVHFHEVGAVDSIVDIVGCCVAMDLLDVNTVLCSELKIGQGTVTCAHGVLPVPAPATSKLIEGFPIRRLAVDAELTTPTGAALLTTLSQGNWTNLPLTLGKIGIGHGCREHQHVPNVIRAYLCDDQITHQLLTILEADIDDDTPERLAYVSEKLAAAGALDVTTMPVRMKKGRDGCRINVLATCLEADSLARVLLDESGTIGVRFHTINRVVLPREAGTVDTPWGRVKVKVVIRPSGVEKVPEFEDCRRLAEETRVPLRKIMLAAAAPDQT
ncbi:MAG: nickel pincer cofactor biosynthesis protein LarC [Lentisphaeria bacterium]|nr:nickel pincer cofactor biosynthesis protein LarC [Lentisphaeria bacterium]